METNFEDYLERHTRNVEEEIAKQRASRSWFENTFCDLCNSTKLKWFDKVTRSFGKLLKKLNIPFSVWPFSHWYYQTYHQPLFGRFHKRVKYCYHPKRWGGRFWIFEFGSRG